MPLERAPVSYSDLLDYLLIDGSRAMTGALDMGTNLINNIVDPTTNQQAATKKYVDDNAGGSPTTTKGDIIVRGASADERFPIGISDGMIIKTLASEPLGFEYVDGPEVGNWTPNIFFGGVEGFSSYIGQSGQYVLDSGYVTANFTTVAGTGNIIASGVATVENLPYASAASSAPIITLLGIYGWTLDWSPVMFGAGTNIALREFDKATGLYTNLTESIFQDAFVAMTGQIMYKAA